jgi:hypothetical protein
METAKFRGRVYHEVPVEDVASNDVVYYIDGGFRCRYVERVTKKCVFVRCFKGSKNKYERVTRDCVTNAWRWHKNVE